MLSIENSITLKVKRQILKDSSLLSLAGTVRISKFSVKNSIQSVKMVYNYIVLCAIDYDSNI